MIFLYLLTFLDFFLSALCMSASSCSIVCLLNFLSRLSVPGSSTKLAMSTSMAQFSCRLGVPRPDYQYISAKLLFGAQPVEGVP